VFDQANGWSATYQKDAAGEGDCPDGTYARVSGDTEMPSSITIL
jgi:hypothetical protein